MNMFFVLALGRSGTRFLASLLGEAEHAFVCHEPFAEDRFFLGLGQCGHYRVVLDDYLEQRFQTLLKEPFPYRTFGEVNSYLRFEVEWLKRKFDPLLIHLVRDGRDFVRSAYSREIYTSLDRENLKLPTDDDPYSGRWKSFNRFQKLCWYWMSTNEYLHARLGDWVQFEKLISDYAYFDAHILKPTGLDIPFELWKKRTTRPMNTSQRRLFRLRVKKALFFHKSLPVPATIPHWRSWDGEMRTQFQEICGETMAKLNYPQDW